MRAYVLPDAESGPVLTRIDPPEPATGEVLVRVTASSVNPHDASVASRAAARYMTYHYPAVLGSDFAGTVEAVGDGVTDLAIGHRVFGLVRERVAARGSFAELVAVPRDWMVRTPPNLDDGSAGALGLAALTAWHCVAAVDSVAGETVLVNGATGGVGSYILQLLAARGVHVVGTARPGDEEVHVRGSGAADVVDWSAGDLAEQVHARYPDGIAAIVDLVTRDKAAVTVLASRVLGPGARLVSTNHSADADQLSGVRAVNVIAEVDQDALRDIADLAEQGHLEAPITRTVAFEAIDEAFTAIGAGALGKVAVQVAGHGH